MSIRVQRICVWVGPVMMVIWMVGFWNFAHFVPPPGPLTSAEALAQMYRENANSIRLGLLLTEIACPLLAPYFIVIMLQMKRIEGRHAPLAYIQYGLGVLLVLAFYFPLMILQTAAYREDRDPNTLVALNDVGWMMFVGVVTITVLQLICIGVAVLQDPRPEPVFPRWAGYFNIWFGLLLSPGSLILFFKKGPLAWNGFFTWWMPLTAFAIWLVVMSVLLFKAVDHQRREEADAPEPRGGSEDDLRVAVERLVARVTELEARTRS